MHTKTIAEILEVVLTAPMSDFVPRDRWIAIVAACAADQNSFFSFSFPLTPIKVAVPNKDSAHVPEPDCVSFAELSTAVALVRREFISVKPTRRERFLANFIEFGVAGESERKRDREFWRDPNWIRGLIEISQETLADQPENDGLRMSIEKMMKKIQYWIRLWIGFKCCLIFHLIMR
jgi:hypothetical protein